MAMKNKHVYPADIHTHQERRDILHTTDLAALVQLHGKAVYGFCFKLTHNHSEADDLYQETFLKALERCQDIDGNQNPKGFLLALAAGIWKNRRRKFAWRQRIAPTEAIPEEDTLPDFVESANPEAIIISKERAAAIQKAADTLSDKLKIPLYMYYTAELSIEEISSALKIPQGTVKSRLYKARQQLKNSLEEIHYASF